VSAVTPRWALIISVTRFSGTPIWRDNSAAEMPSSRNSSRAVCVLAHFHRRPHGGNIIFRANAYLENVG